MEGRELRCAKIESDLDSISLLGKIAKLVLRGKDQSNILEELRAHLLQECDYVQEAEYQALFRDLFQHHGVIKVPRVYPDYSTRRVLTSEYFDGKSLEGFAASADQADRNKMGEAIWDYFNVSRFKHGLFNCDPHGGNFIFSSNQLICLDFGSVKRVPEWYRQHMIQQARGIVLEDRELLREGIEGMGIIQDREAFNFEAHFQFLSIVGAPYRAQAPFRFTSEFRQAMWNAMQTNPNRNHTALPKEEVMAVRCHFGELAAYAALEAESNWRVRMWELLRG